MVRGVSGKTGQHFSRKAMEHTFTSHREMDRQKIINPIPKVALTGLYDPAVEGEQTCLQDIARQEVAEQTYHPDNEVHNKFMNFMFRDGWSEESLGIAIKEAKEGKGCLSAWWSKISTNIEGYVAFREYLDTAHEFLDATHP